jgi:glycine oxidase
VVGAGVIGLTSAFRLARDGWRVSVFDPALGHGATWAAAGMVAPNAEIAPGEFDNYVRQRGAIAAWRDLAGEIRAAGGGRVSVTTAGTLLVGFDAGDRQLIDQHCRVAQEFGVSGERVYRVDRPDMFAGVTPRISEGLLFGDDAWVDPDEIVAGLTAAARELDVTFVAELVTSAATEDESVVVTTASDRVGADVGILATGANALPEGLAARVSHAVRPVRGMTLRVSGVDRTGQPMMRAFVRGRPWYFVSRSKEYGVIGASSDEQAELGVELGELQRLVRDSLDVVPSFESATLLEVREGRRPASTSLEPFFEIVDGRWAWMSGHYRHGVTLAPLSSLEAVDFARSLK